MSDLNNENIIKPLNYQQKLAIDLWCGNRRKSKASALRKAGYSEAVARQPHKFFDSPAVQKELASRGYGIDGISGLTKKSIAGPAKLEQLQEQAQRPKMTSNIDFSKIPKESIQKLREQLIEVGYNPYKNKEEDTASQTQPSFYLEDTPERYPTNENYSSM